MYLGYDGVGVLYFHLLRINHHLSEATDVITEPRDELGFQEFVANLGYWVDWRDTSHNDHSLSC